MVPLTLSGAPMVICLVRDISGRRQLEQQRLINRALEVELGERARARSTSSSGLRTWSRTSSAYR
ncbi:MAG: hypothetical protein HND48_25890 [Chloroflexi bacterium]|nr:hypothetical protein [Chloroflexota bacterium]